VVEQIASPGAPTEAAETAEPPEALRAPLAADAAGTPPADRLEARERALAAAEEQLAAREAAFEQAEARLRCALGAARVGTWTWDLRSGKVVWSEEQYRLLGYEPFAVKPSFSLLSRRCVHADDVARGRSEFETALRERRAYDVEFRVIWPNGEVHWLQSRGRFTLDRLGRAVEMSGVTLDIDRLKQAEQAANESRERLSTIAEATPGTIFTYRETPDGRRTFPYATAHLLETHGVEPEEAARDASLLFSLIHPEDLEAVRLSSEDSARTMSMWHKRFRHFHPRKGEIWIEAYSSPVQEPDGTITWHGIAHDITDIKRAETELLEARARAEAADRAKSAFLANMSHEIRTPMSAILGYVEILSTRLTDVESQQDLETIRSNGRYLLEIIDDILDLSRIEAGKLNLELTRVRPDKLALEVQSLMKLRAADKGLALSIEFNGPLPETIETDATRLRQILINLIENAIKFTQHGGVKVTSTFDAATSLLAVEIADSGMGISPEALSRLFRPFTQADSSLTRRFGGSGLGLSICRALARLLGGDVTVESRIGEGTTFTATIAAGDLAGVAVREVVATDALPVAPRPPSGTLSCSALVVDDLREMRHLAACMLQEAGAQVELAANGQDAIERVLAARERSRSFDVIVLDMQMPVLDGYATAAELRRLGFNRPIVALTANAMKDDERKCLACGCDAYLTKPLDRVLLVDTIARQTQPEAPSTRHDVRRPRVLVVDDSEDICGALTTLLEAAGYEVETTTDGREALVAASCGGFETILLDMGLPGLSGAEVLAQLRRGDHTCDLRFIGLSGTPLAEGEWRRLGFDHYLKKPFEFSELKAVLEAP
jgi:two-component system, chemotaxis family, CheB/CheR fusion protein